MDKDLVEVWQHISSNLTPEQMCRLTLSMYKFCETMYSDAWEGMDEFGRKLEIAQ